MKRQQGQRQGQGKKRQHNDNAGASFNGRRPGSLSPVDVATRFYLAKLITHVSPVYNEARSACAPTIVCTAAGMRCGRPVNDL